MIRKATAEDMESILEIVKIAKEYMKKGGNVTQWAGNYPGEADFRKDIGKQQLYVCYNANMIYGVFAFIVGDEPNYAKIEEGQWLNDKPYGTIHRIAGNGKIKGVFSEVMEFAKEQADDLRIDTHEDNQTMQYLIEKNGFQKCGIIYVEDGTPRIAYQYTTQK